jgi:hypothetical protein
MQLVFNFVVDRMVRDKIYPAMAQWTAEPYTQAWREFGNHWPFTTPMRIQEYCNQHGMPICTFGIEDDFPADALYPVCIGFFDFSIDYFELLGTRVREKVQQGLLRVLFCYHEGDNPRTIKGRLDTLAKQHSLPANCYIFVSANTAAKNLKNFVYFNDFELWYWQRNREVAPVDAHLGPRAKDFTALVRLHKSWRGAVMADMTRNKLLDNSYWSYGDVDKSLPLDDNPIEVDMISRLRWDLEKFLSNAPYQCDSLTSEQHNDHSLIVAEHFDNSYCNIAIETQFDLDQSGGTILTEKTFKPIKHGQLFVIAGPVGSLAELRRLGYRTFDHVFDNSYDTEPNHTRRWEKLFDLLKTIKDNLPDIYCQCHSDIIHNQQLFLNNKEDRLNNLIKDIHEQYN